MPADTGRILRPKPWRPAERHVRIGVSHPSDDPSRYRVFEVRAVCDRDTSEWVAQVAEQNLTEQREGWEPLVAAGSRNRGFPTAAACLGDAVATIIAMVDQDAGGAS